MIERCFDELENKYGDKFCWSRLNSENSRFEDEAYRGINKEHPLYGMKLTGLAKCKLNDDVLFVTEYDQFVVIHLTYSEMNVSGVPQYRLIDTYQELKEYLEWKINSGR